MLVFIVYWTTDRSVQERNPMLDFVAYTAAQRWTADETLSALPSSPIRPDRRRSWTRRRVSVTLRRLADRLDPAPAVPGPALADCR